MPDAPWLHHWNNQLLSNSEEKSGEVSGPAPQTALSTLKLAKRKSTTEKNKRAFSQKEKGAQGLETQGHFWRLRIQKIPGQCGQIIQAEATSKMLSSQDRKLAKASWMTCDPCRRTTNVACWFRCTTVATTGDFSVGVGVNLRGTLVMQVTWLAVGLSGGESAGGTGVTSGGCGGKVEVEVPSRAGGEKRGG